MSKFQKVRPSMGTEPIPLLDEPGRDLKSPSADEEHLPEVYSLGMGKVKGGWVLMMLKSQGGSVLDKEVISGPDILPVIMEQYKLSSLRHLFPKVQKL